MNGRAPGAFAHSPASLRQFAPDAAGSGCQSARAPPHDLWRLKHGLVILGGESFVALAEGLQDFLEPAGPFNAGLVLHLGSRQVPLAHGGRQVPSGTGVSYNAELRHLALEFIVEFAIAPVQRHENRYVGRQSCRQVGRSRQIGWANGHAVAPD